MRKSETKCQHGMVHTTTGLFHVPGVTGPQRPVVHIMPNCKSIGHCRGCGKPMYCEYGHAFRNDREAAYDWRAANAERGIPKGEAALLGRELLGKEGKSAAHA